MSSKVDWTPAAIVLVMFVSMAILAMPTPEGAKAKLDRQLAHCEALYERLDR